MQVEDCKGEQTQNNNNIGRIERRDKSKIDIIIDSAKDNSFKKIAQDGSYENKPQQRAFSP